VYGPERAVAWRILDAQYFGLAQRRRRVFVVSSARDGFDPAAVLFEFKGLRRDSPPSREFEHSVGHGPERSLANGSNLFPCLLKNVETKHWLGNQEAFRGSHYIIEHRRLRFITAVEGERLQGFPDGYTEVGRASDWVRHGALGNSMAVSCIRWIGERIKSLFEAIDRRNQMAIDQAVMREIEIANWKRQAR
jgi:DNA (cytosine-5)-methyltransferase 1